MGSGLGEPSWPGRSHYQVLGVHLLATEGEVRDAYKKLAKTWHPDRRPGDATATDRFQEIVLAYSVLSDPELRAKYDLLYLSALNAEEYLTRYHDFLLTANGLGLQTLDEQRHWESLTHLRFAPRLLRTASA